MEPQTVDFYTAELYLILLSDHEDSFSKYNQKRITDYSFNTVRFKFKQCQPEPSCYHGFHDDFHTTARELH